MYHCEVCQYDLCNKCNHNNESTYENCYPYNNWGVFQGEKGDIVLDKAIVNNHYEDFAWADLTKSIKSGGDPNAKHGADSIASIIHNTCKYQVPNRKYLDDEKVMDHDMLKDLLAEGGNNITLLHKALKNILIRWDKDKPLQRIWGEG